VQLGHAGPASFETLVSASAAAGAWLCLAWLTVGFTVAALAALPGAAGRRCASLSLRIAPAVVRRLACVVFGGMIISGTGVAGPAPAMAAPSPSLPGADVAGRSGVPAGGAPLPDLDRPVPEPAARPPAPRQKSAVHSATERIRVPEVEHEVVVRSGDTLWGIAARHLPADASVAEIAAEWPRWYEANRRVIGTDPDLIRPGQRLRPPADLSEETR
jgi:resuscitation-promoting factor RpfA